MQKILHYYDYDYDDDDDDDDHDDDGDDDDDDGDDDYDHAPRHNQFLLSVSPSLSTVYIKLLGHCKSNHENESLGL